MEYDGMGMDGWIGLCCKALYENSCYDWLWRQFYNRRWLFRRRGAVGKEAYIRRHLTERGMEVRSIDVCVSVTVLFTHAFGLIGCEQEGKASQYSVTTMRGGAIINAMQVRNQDVFVGYEDGRVLVWDASTGGREPKETLAALPDAVQSLWLHRESHLIAVSRHAIMVWELAEAGIQLAWVRGLHGGFWWLDCELVTYWLCARRSNASTLRSHQATSPIMRSIWWPRLSLETSDSSALRLACPARSLCLMVKPRPESSSKRSPLHATTLTSRDRAAQRRMGRSGVDQSPRLWRGRQTT